MLYLINPYILGHITFRTGRRLVSLGFKGSRHKQRTQRLIDDLKSMGVGF